MTKTFLNKNVFLGPLDRLGQKPVNCKCKKELSEK